MRRCLMLVFLLLVVGCGGGEAPGKPEARSDAFRRVEAALVMLPENYADSERHPLLLCLHPAGRAEEYLSHLAPLAKDGRWIVAASTVYRNGMAHTEFLPEVRKAIDEIELSFSVDEDAIFLGGFSGGGMASFVLSHFDPGRYRGVLSNCGALHENLLDAAALKATKLGKVVFLAGKADGTVPLAHLEENFSVVKTAGIPSILQTFDGGHVLAPVDEYRKAMAFLLEP